MKKRKEKSIRDNEMKSRGPPKAVIKQLNIGDPIF